MPAPPKRQWDWYKILTLAVLVLTAYLACQAHELTRNDQRAWVGVQRLQTPSKTADMVKEGLPVTVNAVWQNFGKGPALHTDCVISIRIMRKGEEFDATYEQQGSPKTVQEINVPVSGAALWPGVTYATGSVSLTPTDQEIAEIRLGDKILYFYGKATYSDAFGRPHWTHLCCRYTPDHPGWLAHSTYDEAKQCPYNHPRRQETYLFHRLLAHIRTTNSYLRLSDLGKCGRLHRELSACERVEPRGRGRWEHGEAGDSERAK